MIIRALDVNNDWTDGQGKNNYLSGQAAVAQLIATNLRSFLGDCFFSAGSGIDWFNLLGNKDETALNLAISATILNTSNVTGRLQISVTLNAARLITINYSVTTAFGNVNDVFVFDLGTSV